MKKTLLLFLAASLSVLQANAQPSPDPFFSKKAQSRSAEVTRRLLQLQSGNTIAKKPTGLKQRVIAQVRDPEFFGTDSTRFTYTGTNWSVYDFNNPEYMYTDYFTSEYTPVFTLPFEGNSSTILADSIIKYDQDGAYRQLKAFYRADKKIDSIWSYYLSGTSFMRSRIINVYNAQGYLTASYNLLQNTPPTWDTFSYRHFSYNGTFTQMNRDSTWVGMPSPSLREENIYYYSANTQPDSVVTWDLQGPGPERDYAFYMTYNGAGQLATVRDYDFDSGTPVLSSLDSIGYTSGVGYFTYHETSVYDNDTLSEGTRAIKFVGTNDLVDSIVRYYKPGASSPWEQQGKIKYVYNSYNNPEKLVISFGPLGIADDWDHLFYYETYDDGLSIKPIAESKEVSIYPNPFQNNITIDWKSKQQQSTVRLVNILGQEVFRNDLQLKTGINALNVPGLNSGNYLLLIQDAAGNSWSSKIVKQ